MSRFYVGQRVRIKDTALAPFRGLEGCILSLIDYEYHLGGPAVDLAIAGETDFCGLQADIEPIVPPGMESIAETLALWLPEGMPA